MDKVLATKQEITKADKLDIEKKHDISDTTRAVLTALRKTCLYRDLNCMVQFYKPVAGKSGISSISPKSLKATLEQLHNKFENKQNPFLKPEAEKALQEATLEASERKVKQEKTEEELKKKEVFQTVPTVPAVSKVASEADIDDSEVIL